MLDLRYHVASLSAVFLALVVGILVGVGISGRGFVDKSERRNYQNRISALQSRVDQLSAEKSLLSLQGEAGRAFADDTYPVLMHDRLAGKDIALIVIGSSGGALGDVRQALADSGAATTLYRVLKVPVPVTQIRNSLAAVAGFHQLDDVGHELALEWTTIGKTPIDDRISPLVVEEQRGSAGTAVNGVVVLEGAPPPDSNTQLFLDGFLAGLGTAGVPIVATEKTDAAPTLVPTWQRVSGVSTVDDVDTPSGKLALALLLGGAPSGNFGVKATADAALPRIEPAG